MKIIKSFYLSSILLASGLVAAPANKTIQRSFLIKLKSIPESIKKSSSAVAPIQLQLAQLKSGRVKKSVSISRSTPWIQLAIEFPEPTAEDQIIREIKLDPQVAAVEPNYEYKVQGFKVVGGQQFSGTAAAADLNPYLWGLDNRSNTDIDATALFQEPWMASLDDSIKVAVIDSGVDYMHADLKNQILVNNAEEQGVEGFDDDGNGVIDDVVGASFVFGEVSNEPFDDNGHGTHCAGIIGAEHNDIGVKGVAPKVKILPIKFLGKEGSGFSSDAIAAIDYAIARKVDIISSSWGGAGMESKALKEAIERAKAKGIIFVAAAGNDGRNMEFQKTYPAAFEVSNIIVVGAYGRDGQVSSFSNYGANVHLVAPGAEILSSVPYHSYAAYSGTSMATPYVSGALALGMSKLGRKDIDFWKNFVQATSVKNQRLYQGRAQSSGRLNVTNMINARTTNYLAPVDGSWKTVVLADQGIEPLTITKVEAPGTIIKRSFKLPKKSFVRINFDTFVATTPFDVVKVFDETGKLILSNAGYPGMSPRGGVIYVGEKKSVPFIAQEFTIEFHSFAQAISQAMLTVTKIEINDQVKEVDSMQGISIPIPLAMAR